MGTENQNLPAYVVLDDPEAAAGQWHSELAGRLAAACLPGHAFPLGRPAAAESQAAGKICPLRWWRPNATLLRRLDEAHRRRGPGYPDLDARISSYELAARMQLDATDALDLSKESEETKEMYGLNEEATASYGKRCLMARRLVERGVRFVQIFIECQIWDAHSDLEDSLRYCCGKTDSPPPH